MPSKSYEHLILINDNSNFDIDLLVEKINFGNNNMKVTKDENSINIMINDWLFTIGLNKANHIIEESYELANEFAKNHHLYEQIKSCKKRLEIAGDIDFEMNYFNDFCFILEKVESFTNVYSFNPHEGFLNI